MWATFWRKKKKKGCLCKRMFLQLRAFPRSNSDENHHLPVLPRSKEICPSILKRKLFVAYSSICIIVIHSMKGISFQPLFHLLIVGSMLDYFDNTHILVNKILAILPFKCLLTQFTSFAILSSVLVKTAIVWVSCTILLFSHL